MKRNWPAIVLLVAFIIAYQILVLQPAQVARQPQMPPQTSDQTSGQKLNEAPAEKPSTAAMAQKNDGPGLVTGSQAPAIRNQKTFWEGSYEISLSANRRLRVSTSGALGPLLFNDYTKRGKPPQDQVQILLNPLRWSSNNIELNECLSQMDRQNENPPRFSQTINNGSCGVEYKISQQKPNVLDIKLELSGFNDPAAVVELRGAGTLGEGAQEDHNTLVYRLNGDVEWAREQEIFDVEKKEGLLSWAAFGDKYFINLFAPKGAYNPSLIKGRLENPEVETAYYGIQYPLVTSAPGAATKYELDLYLGTRDPNILVGIADEAVGAVDYGFFAVVAKAMSWLLAKIYGFAGNYGVAIILLTLLVRAVFWPLNRKVFVSGLKMKSLQPKMDAIRKKYGSDKSKATQMNQEIFGLYKEHKVNPLGSCLPLVAQMPIFIGLWGALQHSLDLYQSPFMLWITDLSSKDPYFIFPVLWTVSLFGYIKLNPQMQQQPGMPNMIWIQYGMNLFFGFLAKDWPAGLTLYLVVSNLVGILQQVMLRKTVNLNVVQEGA